MPPEMNDKKGTADTNIITWETKINSRNPELLRKAQEELNENPETRNQVVQELRELVLGEHGLQSPYDDAFLLRFLRVGKFNVDQAFKRLKKYYRIRLDYPEIFNVYTPTCLINIFKQKGFVKFQHKDQHGREILLFRLGLWNPSKTPVDEAIAAVHMWGDNLTHEEENQVNGVVVIMDCRSVSFAQVRCLTPRNLMKFASLIRGCLPIRFKAFHLLFVPDILLPALALFKCFLSAKLRSRIHSYGHDLTSLYKHIPPEYLPEEYGGEDFSIEQPVPLEIQNLASREEEIATFLATTGYKKDKVT